MARYDTENERAMNYYPHHIGDYSRDTAHLSILEDGAYRRMLDLYYASERQLPKNREAIYRLVRARSKEEKSVVDTLLGEFFTETESGWRHERCEKEILKAKEKSEKAAASASMRWHKEPDANAMRTHSEGNAPNNQKPITKDKSIVGQRPDGYREKAESVLSFLNESACKDYKPVKANLDLIAARLREGATVEDCKAVVSRKVAEWSGGDMAQYLRPATLFNATKFAQYQGESSKPRITVDA